MENAKDPYAMNQNPQQPFMGQGVAVGSADQQIPVGQPIYNAQYPPNQYPQNQYPQNQYPPNQYPPNQYPPNQYPQNQYPQNQYPQNQYPGQVPPMVNPQNVVIVDANMMRRTKPRQRLPEMIHCNRCNVQNLSRITYEPGNGTWVAVFGMFVFGCWPCCLIPLCVQDCQDCKHYCSVCGEYLGKKKFLIDEDD